MTLAAAATAAAGIATGANACSGAYLFETPAQATAFGRSAEDIKALGIKAGGCSALDRAIKRNFVGIEGEAPLLESGTNAPIYQQTPWNVRIGRFHMKGTNAETFRVGAAGGGTSSYSGTPVNRVAPTYVDIPSKFQPVR
ncbi:MAG: hypothetical protein AAF988_07505 [Pseudomonadota bacterium]